MARKVPPTRFPDAVAVSYYRNVKQLIDELGKVTLRVFDESIKPEIKNYRNRVDDAAYRLDGPLDVIRQAIEVMKGLSLGIFNADTILNKATNFVNGLNVFNKKNMQDQGRVKGIDPTQFEPWLDEFMRTSIAENVSYISTIRDEYFLKIESIIYQGVKNGSSPKDIRDQLVKRIGMSVNRAKFLARDQTGSILGQMTAERHKAMDAAKFKWSTSKDERVRDSHNKLEGKVFKYANPPTVGLPGTDFQCRCVAFPVFDDSEPEPESPVIEFKDNKQVKEFFKTDKFIESLTAGEYQAINTYTSEAYTEINGYLRGKGRGSNESDPMIETISNSISDALKKSPIGGNIRLYRSVGSFNFIKNLKVGKTFTDYGFVSTTPLKDSTFIDGSTTMMHINVPIGTNCAYIDPISEYPGEEEVLLDKGTTFEIKEIIDDHNFICEVVGTMKTAKKDQLNIDAKAPKANENQGSEVKEKPGKRSDRFTWKEDDVVFH